MFVCHCDDIPNLKLPNSLRRLSLTEDGGAIGKDELALGVSHLHQFPYNFPDRLEEISIGVCDRFVSLPQLPDGLEILWLRGGKVRSLPSLPRNLKYMQVYSPLDALPQLPPKIEELNLWNWGGKLSDFPELPDSLEVFEVGGTIETPQLPRLPANLTVIELTGWTELAAVTELPQITHLKLSNCPKLSALDFPDSTKDLLLEKLPALCTLPLLPAGMDNLEIIDCPFDNLDNLPKQLNRLEIRKCARLLELNLNSDPAQITVQECPNLRAISRLPLDLELVWIADCPSLRELPPLPHRATRIDLSGCASITEIPFLPKSLVTLNLYGCEQLVSLPELPPSLFELNIGGCKSLQITKEEIRQIDAMLRKRVQERYPNQVGVYSPGVRLEE